MTEFEAHHVEIRTQEICVEAARIREAMTAPHVLMRPALSIDGTAWLALYGDDLVTGVAGFGDTPAEAMAAFDHAWLRERTPKAVLRDAAASKVEA